MIKVTENRCDDCIHRSVCCYKDDFNDICKAVGEANVHKSTPDGKSSSKQVTYYDILSELVVNCRHYRRDEPTPRYKDLISTNPAYDISTSTTTITNDCIYD